MVAHVDLMTGEVTMSVESLPDDATVAGRFAELKAGQPAPSGAQKHAGMRCDRCGREVRVDFENPQLPPGWVADERGDFCPACHAAN